MLFEQQRIDGSDIESLTPQENRKVFAVNAGGFQPNLYFVGRKFRQGRKQTVKTNGGIGDGERLENLFLLIQNTAVVLFGRNVKAARSGATQESYFFFS